VITLGYGDDDFSFLTLGFNEQIVVVDDPTKPNVTVYWPGGGGVYNTTSPIKIKRKDFYELIATNKITVTARKDNLDIKVYLIDKKFTAVLESIERLL
jgi:hypothetical protein